MERSRAEEEWWSFVRPWREARVLSWGSMGWAREEDRKRKDENNGGIYIVVTRTEAILMDTEKR